MAEFLSGLTAGRRGGAPRRFRFAPAGVFLAMAAGFGVLAIAVFARGVLFPAFFPVDNGFESASVEQFTVFAPGGETVMELRVLKRGIIMVPVNDFAALCGYTASVCDPCGNNELESSDPLRKRKDGLIIVKWETPHAYLSARTGKITLRAPTRRLNGVTWTDIGLFRKLGTRVRTDLSAHTVRID